MVKAGSFKPGRGSAPNPGTSKGRNGPSDGGSGTTHTGHTNTGTNRSGGVGDNSKTTQWHPGKTDA